MEYGVCALLANVIIYPTNEGEKTDKMPTAKKMNIVES